MKATYSRAGCGWFGGAGGCRGYGACGSAKSGDSAEKTKARVYALAFNLLPNVSGLASKARVYAPAFNLLPSRRRKARRP